MWIWKKTISQSNEEEWQQKLAGVPGAVFSRHFSAKRINIDVYCDEAAQAFALQACWGGSTKEENTTDWVAATAPENMPPLMIRDRLVISTSEAPATLGALKKKYPRREILSFPAERAFGTGNHATTATCLRMLCDEAKRLRGTHWSVVDIGCGTGVLAIAALRLGAARAIGFDFDPLAVEVARRNVERNGGADGLELFQADIFKWAPADEEEKGDVTLANLFSTVLQQAFPRILAAMKEQSVLIISGILNTQAEETLTSAAKAGLKTVKTVSQGKWTTAKLERA